MLTDEFSLLAAGKEVFVTLSSTPAGILSVREVSF